MELRHCDYGKIVIQNKVISGIEVPNRRIGHIVGLTLYNGKAYPLVKWAKEFPKEGYTEPVDPHDMNELKFSED